ncbi:MAG: hypothetical protein ACI4SX_04805, partial [Candidatus Fimenecus sp.]
MKNGKNLIVFITSIILVAYIGLSFLLYDKSESVTIKAVAGSYAEEFAEDNDLEFVPIEDSDNLNEYINDNGTFSYKYVGDKSVTIVGCKGNKNFVVIPDRINNLPVTKVDFDPFEAGVETIQFPESVVDIKGEYSTPRYTVNFFASLAVLLIGYIYAA